MDKSVEKYLREHGHTVDGNVVSGEADAAASPLGYGEWFGEHVLGLDSEAYRRAFWREAHATGGTIGHVPRTLDSLLYEQCGSNGNARCGLLLALALLQGGIFPFWLLGRLLAREISHLRRGTYYERERARRHRLADERRAIRIRRTVNPCPTLDAVRAAWNEVRATTRTPAAPAETPSGPGPHARAVLRLGALLEDLERYVDNHAYVTRGVPGIRGRAPGIKGLFAKEAPDLREAYKAVMRCKAVAKRYRQACACDDPVPPEALLPATPDAGVGTRDFAAERSAAGSGEVRTVGGVEFPVFPCLGDVGRLRAWMAAHGNTAYLRTQNWVPRPEGAYTERHLLRPESLELAAETLRFGDGTLVALEAAVALRIDPDCVARDPGPGARVRTLLGGRRPLRVAGRVRSWISRWAGRAGFRLGTVRGEDVRELEGARARGREGLRASGVEGEDDGTRMKTGRGFDAGKGK